LTGDPALGQRTPESAQPRTDPALDGALGLAQEDRDRAVWMTAEVGELDRGSFVLGQARQRVANKLCLCELPHLVFEVVVAVGSQTGAAFLTRPARRLGAYDVDAASMDLGEEVYAQRSSCGIERSGWFQSRRNTSCTTSSASARSATMRRARLKAAAAWRWYTSARASWRKRPIDATSWASLARRRLSMLTSWSDTQNWGDCAAPVGKLATDRHDPPKRSNG
jgi:hypothetical protein